MTVSPEAARLYSNDPSAAAFGIDLISADGDHAEVRMMLREEMCNGYGIAHGGMTFLLADSAMAFASNSTGGRALATSAAIDWVAPVYVGTVLVARAQRRSGGGRSVVWDIVVRTAEGAEVAVFRGRTRIVAQANSEPR